MSYRARITAVLVAALCLLGGFAGAASAAVTTPGVAITNFPATDFVSAEGYLAGEVVRVEVLRNGVVIGTSGDVAAVGGAVEINHAGPPCWVGGTPDILVGDVVRATIVSSSSPARVGAADTHAVSDIVVTQGPAQTSPGVVTVTGTARTPAGAPLPAAELEVRLITTTTNFSNGRNRVQAPGDGTIAYDAPGSADWTATFALTPADVARALSAETQARHLTSLVEVTIFEFEGAPGPSPGCEAAPLARNAVTAVTPAAVNAAGQGDDLQVAGSAQGDATAVGVTVTDGTTTLGPVPAVLSPAVNGGRTWTATVPDVDTLADGTLTVAGSYTVPGGTIAGVTRAVQKDTGAPAAPAVDAPAEGATTGPSVTAAFTGGEPGLAFECRLDGAAFAPCTPPRQLTGLAHGSHQFRVRATDAAGNTGGETVRSWTVDAVAPEVEITGPVASPAPIAPSGDITFDAGDAVSVTCTLDGTPIASCASPQPFAGLATGTHAIHVTGTDAAGNAATATRQILVDADPPVLGISSPAAGAVTGPSVTATFSASGAQSVECAVDSGAFGACTSAGTHLMSGLATGGHVLHLRATDAVGNVATLDRAFTADATAPAIGISAPADGATVASSTQMTFTADEPSTFACRVDGTTADPFSPCSSPFAATGLSGGPHTLRVRAQDAVGNVSFAARAVVVDATAPVVTVDSPGAGATVGSSVLVEFSADDPAALFECRLDAGSFQACSSPQAYQSLSQGQHTVQVRAEDAVGNVSAVVSRAFTVDATAPAFQVQSNRPALTNQTTAQLTFSADETVTGVECSLDGAAFAACTSPVGLNGLTGGAHTFSVRGTDLQGNLGAAQLQWTVDLVQPTVTVVAPAEGATVADQTPQAAFTVSETASTECSLDGAAFAACTSPHQMAGVADGVHTLQVRATDTAGNLGPTVSRAFTVDTTAPGVTITSPAQGATVGPSVVVAFASGDPQAQFECRIDAGAFEACTSPHAFTGAGTGDHTVQVRASDPAGNVSAPSSRLVVVDATAPSVSVQSALGAFWSVTQGDITFSSGEPVGGFECSLDGAAFAACTSPFPVSGLAGGPHSLQVRATDAQGNTGTGLLQWTVDQTPPSATIVQPANLATVGATPQLTFTLSEPGSAECRVDAGTFVACDSGLVLGPLGGGAHTVQVRPIDRAGNVGAAAARSFAVDATAPVVTIDSPAPGTATGPSPVVAFHADEAGVRFECRTETTAFAPCDPPAGLTGLTGGPHTFQVRATDAVGNTGPVAALSFTVASPVPVGVTEAAVPGGGGSPAPVAGRRAVALLSLSSPARLSRRVVRARGLRLLIGVDEGTQVVRVRIFRRAGGARRLVLVALRVPAGPGARVVTLLPAVVRRVLVPGRYEVEVTPGASRAELGASRTAGLRVT